MDMNDLPFDPDQAWDEYPPGRPLPDSLPPEMKALLSDVQRRGATVKLAWNEDGTVKGAIAEGHGPDESLTEGHEAHCGCKLCEANKTMQKVNATQELDADEKLEAAIKLAGKLSEQSQADGDLSMTANLLVNGLQFAAQRENRRWLVEQVRGRLASQTLTMISGPTNLAKEGESVTERVTRVGEGIKATLQVQDTGSLLTVLSRGRPDFRFRDFKEMLAEHNFSE